MTLPPQPPTAQPGGAPAQPEPPKKSKKTLYIVLGIVALFILLCGGCGAMVLGGANEVAKEVDKAIASAEASPSEEAPAAIVSGLNKPARDGNFQFTVKKVQCGVNKVGDQYLKKTAQGQYCVVTVTVKNVKNEPQTLSDTDQVAYVGTASYHADSEAGMYANNNQTNVLFNEINPGNSVTGKMLFDIPKGKKLTKLELHDSAFSGGVEVNL
jgi:hypothetical protein